MLQAEKRAHHNALERKRRDHIKESFHSLRDSVPSLQGEKVSESICPLYPIENWETGAVFLFKGKADRYVSLLLLKEEWHFLWLEGSTSWKPHNAQPLPVEGER